MVSPERATTPLERDGRCLPDRGLRGHAPADTGAPGPCEYPEFLKRFPSFAALAGASQADVVRAWSGLGYNNRAVRLHRLALKVREMPGERLPQSTGELVRLPGIGRYTAHAILCSVFGRRVPVVDINVRRFFSRLFWPHAGHRQPPDGGGDLEARLARPSPAAGLRLEPGAHGSGRADLHEPCTAVRGMSRRPSLQVESGHETRKSSRRPERTVVERDPGQDPSGQGGGSAPLERRSADRGRGPEGPGLTRSPATGGMARPSPGRTGT